MKINAGKKYLILVILIVVFAAGFFIMNSAYASSPAFVLRNGEDINSIMLTNVFGTFIFTKQQNSENWVVETDGISYTTHAAKMELILEVLSNMPVRRVLDSEMDDYGLKYPAAFVVLGTNAGRRYEYSFGKNGSDVHTVYAKSMTSDVFLTDSFVSDQLTGSLAAYRNKNVFSVDILNIESLEYLSGGQAVINCYKETPIEWYMNYPWIAPARHIELTEMLARMTNWVIAGFPETIDLNEAGLDAPLETLILVDRDGNRQTLDFGSINGLTRYARTGERGDIVLLYAQDIDFSILSPDTLLFIAPFRTPIAQVSGLSVSHGNEAWDLSYDQGLETAFWNYGILNNEEFVRIFFRFISMVADGRDTGTVPRLHGYPLATLSLNRTDGTSSRLELFPRNENGFFMRINGEDTPYYIHAERLSNLLDRISEQAEGKSNTIPL